MCINFLFHNVGTAGELEKIIRGYCRGRTYEFCKTLRTNKDSSEQMLKELLDRTARDAFVQEALQNLRKKFEALESVRVEYEKVMTSAYILDVKLSLLTRNLPKEFPYDKFTRWVGAKPDHPFLQEELNEAILRTVLKPKDGKTQY